MPIYEYECENCGRIEEVLQRFSDEPLTRCRHCAGKLHKLVSQSSFHLKGGGWYVTDYARKDGGRSEKAAEKPAAGGADAGSTGSGEKSDAKSD
ncbi:MAG: zinc ribbon domain-containing protein [Desulfobacterales bacterium]|jgi:putative FmdB family regulatory protein|nr:zinc ribbon domain-containing protein [Desulfobacteraceae bacterium]MDD3992936.1 zinc ribbon domain-containing protein [Desulfobacteraceae bacterium]MDY0313185.1 zinc ribbon domain-containing protein [Desulfobacterales bacterium]